MSSYPIRSFIKAPEGYSLISADLSAAEAWVVAYLAADENMKKYLGLKKLHEFAASVIFDKPLDQITYMERYTGKKGNHSLNYKTSAEELVRSINKEGIITISVAKGKIYYAKWHTAFNVKYWWREIEDKINRTRTITTTYGRKRVFYGIINSDLLKEATAYEPQSTVADHMNGAVHDELNIKGGLKSIYENIILPSNNSIRMIQTAYDSILIECPTNLCKEIGERVVKELERPLIVNGQSFTIPVDCDIYPERWGEGAISLDRFTS